MTLSWKIAAPIASVLVIVGAAIAWQVHKSKANEQKLAEDATASRMSAEQGDAKAESRLGTMYYHGQGVQQDYAEAIRWYRKAADHGDASAQYYLGYMYYEGQAASQDFVEALRWYHKAADQGDAQAMQAIGSLYYLGKGMPQDNVEAARWFRKAADQGYARAQYDLGYLYDYGYGLPQDRAEADRWYQKAAAQGDESAQRALRLKGRGLNFWGKITLWAIFFACLESLRAYLKYSERPRPSQQQTLAMAALFGLAYVGLSLYVAFGNFNSTLAANAFYLVKYLVSGAAFAMLIGGFQPNIRRLALSISGTLFLAINLLAITRHDLGRFASILRGFWSSEGLLSGVSISLIILLWLTHKSSKPPGQHSTNQALP